jgi:DNA-binding XRE family transcriptional regulator
MTPIGQAIKDKGLLKGWVAKQVGIAPSTLSNIIKGNTPNLAVAIKLARLLDTTVEELWGHLAD